MSYRAESRITECHDYLRVDFGSGSLFELSETYRTFADVCIGRQVNRALLNAGDNDPEGHRLLRHALSAMARTAAIPEDFKLALVSSTAPVQAIYLEAQQALRAIGLNAWLFDSVNEAVEWLEGRAASGRTAS
jgi:hypothetical protein